MAGLIGCKNHGWWWIIIWGRRIYLGEVIDLGEVIWFIIILGLYNSAKWFRWSAFINAKSKVINLLNSCWCDHRDETDVQQPELGKQIRLTMVDQKSIVRHSCEYHHHGLYNPFVTSLQIHYILFLFSKNAKYITMILGRWTLKLTDLKDGVNAHEHAYGYQWLQT